MNKPDRDIVYKVDPQDSYEGLQQGENWFVIAERLRRAAEILLVSAEAQQAAFAEAAGRAANELRKSPEPFMRIDALLPDWETPQLLYGYAIENMLKALILARNPMLVSKTALSEDLKKHDGVVLSFLAEFETSDEERNLLFRLQQMVTWAGRYPTASKFKWHVRVNPSGGTPYGLIKHDVDHPVMTDLYDRLRQTIIQVLGRTPNNDVYLMEPKGD